MKSSWVKYIGFLGFLGFLGYITGAKLLYSNFAFFSFFAWGSLTNDERLKINVNKGARNAFLGSMIVYMIIYPYALITKSIKLLALGFIVTFVVQILVFIISVVVIDSLRK